MLSTSKVNGCIEREVRLLASCVDECATRLVALFPEAGLTVNRVPERFVLQAGNIGVTVSLFRSRAGADVGAEVVLGLWDGEVTFPGRAPREGRQAIQRQMQQFHIMASDDETSWLWQDDATMDTMTSRALAMVCVKTMAEQLQSNGSALQSDTVSSLL